MDQKVPVVKEKPRNGVINLLVFQFYEIAHQLMLPKSGMPRNVRIVNSSVSNIKRGLMAHNLDPNRSSQTSEIELCTRT